MIQYRRVHLRKKGRSRPLSSLDEFIDGLHQRLDGSMDGVAGDVVVSWPIPLTLRWWLDASDLPRERRGSGLAGGPPLTSRPRPT